MNRLEQIAKIRNKLKNNLMSVGSWIQLPNASIAEIMGNAGYDWIAIDLEHGSISLSQLPDLNRAIELGNTLPLVRLANGNSKDCKHALDSGAGGVIIPMIENAKQLLETIDYCCWPPIGKRGVGFSRANLFGKNFDSYKLEAQQPLIVAMIENVNAVLDLENILNVKGLDAIFIGPYDLSASMGDVGNFKSDTFCSTLQKILDLCKKKRIACGIHVVDPDLRVLKDRKNDGYQFIAYSIDSVFLSKSIQFPNI
jgi:2-dehydro-3-deoxyglucarate aldolase